MPKDSWNISSERFCPTAVHLDGHCRPISIDCTHKLSVSQSAISISHVLHCVVRLGSCVGLVRPRGLRDKRSTVLHVSHCMSLLVSIDGGDVNG